MNAEKLTKLLHQKIPISQTLHFEISDIQSHHATGHLNLAANINHKSTLFGGSLYSGCALTAYSLFLYSLKLENFKTDNIVISEGNIKYLKPMDQDATFKAEWPDENQRLQFFKTLREKKKARIDLIVRFYAGSTLCGEFVGAFVAFDQ